MIYVQLSGGIGNQLFQIGAALAYSHENGHAVQISRESGGLARNPYWDAGSLFRHIAHLAVPDIGAVDCEYYEEDHRPIPACDGAHTMKLSGNFQSFQYFDSQFDHIDRALHLRDQRREVISKIGEISPSGIRQISVSMHFRRGDYLSAKCYHLVLDEYYYSAAVRRILAEIPAGPVRFVAFCQMNDAADVERIVARLKSEIADDRVEWEFSRTTVRPASTVNIADWEEMLVMSAFDHHIMANSTFSWWSAYIGAKLADATSRKCVVLPDIWFNHNLYYLKSSGYCVPGWIPIPSFDPEQRACECDRLWKYNI